MLYEVITEFKDEQSGMFYFTPSNTDLLARKMEINDNVIPSVITSYSIHYTKLYDREICIYM